MLYSVENREHLVNLEELASLQNRIEEMWLHDKLGKQNFQQNRKKIFETVSDKLENTSEKFPKTLNEPSLNSNKALEILNEKVLELSNDKGVIAPYLASSLVNLLNLKTKVNITK